MRSSERRSQRDPEPEYDEESRQMLRDVARASIEHGLRCGVALDPDPAGFPVGLRAVRACFVTLRSLPSGDLRGCIGGLEASLPLVAAVASSAFSAAFRDPRFPGLRREELADLDIHLAILSPLADIEVTCEREFCERLRPGIDGVVLAEGRARATFLPDVWHHLRDPVDFVRELKKKAGLPEQYWSSSMRLQLYTAESF